MPDARRVIGGLLAIVLIAPAALAREVGYPTSPKPPIFVVDEAAMIAAGDLEWINAQLTGLHEDAHFPVAVVTIESMAGYGAGHMSIEAYARDMFDEYGLGHPNWNYGILLLVSERDRKARIELGAEWGRDHDRTCRTIMDGLIIARFKQGKFSEGIRGGVEGITAMCRNLPLPEAASQGIRSLPTGWLGKWGVFGCVGVLVLGGIVLRLMTRVITWVSGGRIIFGWPFTGHHLYGSGSSGASGGGFSGFSGGGFSGGGGATGGW